MKKTLKWNRDELLGSPLFEPLHAVLSHLEVGHFPALGELNALLAMRPAITVQSGKRLRFVAQGLGKQAFESQYEPRCYLSGEVQTRDNNLHDLFNALVWLTFPQGKAAINMRHYRALMAASVDASSQRGAVRDMAALFDESGVIVASADAELSGLLRDFKWKELFWSRREDVTAAMGFYIFGHGLHEKAMQPYIGMTGQGLVLQVDAEFFNWPLPRKMQHLDERVAAYLDEPSNCQSTRELTPVPLLGIPGWSSDNERAEYYENRNYFRPGRRTSQVDPIR
ncbi:MAG: DUF3025 domain-containing protein [Gallionellaceae bacterium]|nr:MAG: DUF3025 domain-containing protein [Gallionellaceae bacterium]